jgi:catalase
LIAHHLRSNGVIEIPSALARKNMAMAANNGPVPAAEDSCGDALAQQAADIEALAKSMPHNANKSKEFGRDNAILPPTGQTLESRSQLASASILSESNLSAKTSGGAASLECR